MESLGQEAHGQKLDECSWGPGKGERKVGERTGMGDDKGIRFLSEMTKLF